MLLKKKTHAIIVAPLKKMANNLKDYIRKQNITVKRFNDEKEVIDNQILYSKNEISESENTLEKLNEMVSIIKPEK